MSKPQDVSRPQAAPIRCLVVDDQPEFLEAARRLLGRQGISVVGVATGGAEAIERVVDLRPDVVLVDVNLGEENGLEVASRIAVLGQAGSPRVILISSYPKDDLAGALPAGTAIGFVPKTDLSATTIRTALGLTPDGEIAG